jgi:TatD DNase family protein
MLSLQLIDTHAHLDMACFDPDRAQVIAQARSSGVYSIVVVGIDLPSVRSLLSLARSYTNLLPSVGIHPQESKDVTEQDLATLTELAETPGVVAIGEIGLDYYRDYCPRGKQLTVFRYQLELAARLQLPVLLHCREAEIDFIPTLKIWLTNNQVERPGLIHCFSGSLQCAHTYLNLGFRLGLGGYLSYPSSKVLREVVKEIPLESLVLETDCPFLPPQSHRGLRNEPAYVLEIAATLARIKGVDVAEVAKITTETARSVFGIS